MSTSEDDASTKPANNHDGMTSERARSIARRAFLRKSVGVAAPVVMTLQSGPAAAIQSITCQHKTPIDNAIFDDTDGSGKATHPLSGFIDRPTLDSRTDDSRLELDERIDKLFSGGNVDFGGLSPDDPTFLDAADQQLSANDGFVRCEKTTSAAWSGGPDTFVYNGPNGGQSLAPNTAIGPVAMHTIGPDGEDQFVGCYGDSSISDPDARPLTCSCWSSLHPGP